MGVSWNLCTIYECIGKCKKSLFIVDVRIHKSMGVNIIAIPEPKMMMIMMTHPLVSLSNVISKPVPKNNSNLAFGQKMFASHLVQTLFLCVSVKAGGVLH